MKKKIVVVIVLLSVCTIGFGMKVGYDYIVEQREIARKEEERKKQEAYEAAQKKLLKDHFEELLLNIMSSQTDKAKKMIDEPQTAKDYLIVEKLLNEELLPVINADEKSNNAIESLESEKMKAPEEIAVAGGSFAEPIEIINDFCEPIDDFKKQVARFEKVDNFFPSKKLDKLTTNQKKIVEWLKPEIAREIKESDVQKTLEDLIEVSRTLKESLEAKRELYIYLRDTQGSWQVEGGRLTSTDEIFINEYNIKINTANEKTRAFQEVD
ncbi:MAG: hypothetical protein ACRCUP_02320 [Mycoplasmatales bacterium]